MQPDERIRRMEQDGILTPGQAAMLRDSLGPVRPRPDAAPAARGRVSLVWTLGGLGVLLGLGLVAAVAGGGLEPGPVQDVAQSLNQPGGFGEMNRPMSAVLAIALLLAIPALLWAWMHNSIVSKEEHVFETWAQTESNLQRRADLVPGLVETVSRYIKHEAETFTGVAEKRQAAAERLSETIDSLARAEQQSVEILRRGGGRIVEDEDRLVRLFEAQGALRRSMTSLFAVAEAYPELRSSDQFLELQAQLEGTENRINVARMRFNDAVRDYNGTIRMLPWSLVAQLGRFQRKAYFRSDEEARSAPDIRIQ